MKMACHLTMFLMVLLAAAGCAPSLVQIKGKVVMKGQPVTGEGLTVALYPAVEGDAEPDDYELTHVRRDGTFSVPGKNGKGIRPGRYWIAVRFAVDADGHETDPYEASRDRLKGIFGPKNSPLVREFVRNETIVVDVAKKEITSEQ